MHDPAFMCRMLDVETSGLITVVKVATRPCGGLNDTTKLDAKTMNKKYKQPLKSMSVVLRQSTSPVSSLSSVAATCLPSQSLLLQKSEDNIAGWRIYCPLAETL